MIGLISLNNSFRQALSRALSDLGFSDIRPLQPDLSDLVPQIQTASLLVVDAHSGPGYPSEGAKIPPWADQLRACYKGAILFLAFMPREKVQTWLGGDLLDTPGCSFGQLPLTLGELRALIDSATPPTPSEWEDTLRTRRRRELIDRASLLAHRYENTFSQPLSSLLELQKLSGFQNPDSQRLKREIEIIRSRLSTDRLDSFFTDLRMLGEQAANLELLELARSLNVSDTRIARIKEDLQGLSLVDGAKPLKDVLQVAQDIRSTLKEFLAVVAAAARKYGRQGDPV